MARFQNQLLCPDRYICILDDVFLLRFLRVRKYNNDQAFKMLERFMASGQSYPQWFQNLTFDDDRMRRLYETGYIFPLKERTRNGCRVIMIQAGRLDTKIYSFSDVLKIINLVLFTLLEEHETQIAGFVYIIDHKDISIDYVTLFSLMDMKNYLKLIQNAIPCRQKLAIFTNLPSIAVALTDFAKSFVSDKLKQRAYFYKDFDKLYDHVEREILPKEYGGVIAIDEMMETFRKTVEVRKSRLREIDEQRIDVVRFNAKQSEAVDSFRKLEID